VRFLAVAPKAVEEVATLGEHLASPSARYAIVDLLVDHAAASGDFGKAPRRLQGFLERRRAIWRRCCGWSRCASTAISRRRSPPRSRSWPRPTSKRAKPEKARVIAEDLLLRNPRSSTHKDRLRRVLVTLARRIRTRSSPSGCRCSTRTPFAEEEPRRPPGRRHRRASGGGRAGGHPLS
jgi:hypothetical protein